MIWILLFFTGITYGDAGYCSMAMACYPSTQQIKTFDDTIDGSVYKDDDQAYLDIVVMKNTRVTKKPDLIVFVQNSADVQKAILFAREYNLKVVVQSSGHDFQGRSTADDSFMIYLGNMTNIEVNTSKTDRSDAGEVVLESGKQWVDVYIEVDKHSRVVVGGSAHTVAIGGWALGGGHSPISGVAGLGVDNLLEVEMVTADGKIVVADNTSTFITYPNGTTHTSSNSDIFWALSGGGGGTFGIATKFTFKMHFPPSGMVTFNCDYPIIHQNGSNVGKTILRKYSDLVPNMPPAWGGFLIVSSSSKIISKLIYRDDSVGSISIYMNHFGDFNSQSRSYMEPLMNIDGLARFCYYENLSTFWEYEKNITDAIYIRSAIIGTLMQADSFSDSWIEFLVDYILRAYRENLQVIMSMTGILLGGKVNEASTVATSVHPGWRSAVMSTTVGVGWGNDDGDKNDTAFLNLINSYQNKLYTFGDGMYPNEAGSNVPSFSTHFWGSNYGRLLKIKQEWDPDNTFTCLQCVGYTASTSSSDYSSRGSKYLVTFLILSKYLFYRN
ncbi:uncharacterized protein LOC134707038 isoform X2 [Mytilus trossulus]